MNARTELALANFKRAITEDEDYLNPYLVIRDIEESLMKHTLKRSVDFV